ncbi:MAG: extracellular solute-binding protein [bacterium]
MLKKCIYLVFIIVFILPLTGCGSSNTGGNTQVTPTPAPSNDQKITLVWWNLFETKENVQPLIDAYQAANPNVEIQYEQKGLNGDITGYINSLDEALLTNEAERIPDIYTIHNTWTGKYETSLARAPESVFPLTDLTDFYPVVSQDFVRNGIVALPMYMDALAVIYNIDKLQAAGYTTPDNDWSRFETQAQEITKKSPYGFSAADPNNTEFYFDVLNLLLMQNGVTMTDGSGTSAIFASQKDGVGAITFYNDFLKGTTPTWNATQKKDVAAFLEGDLAMYIAPSWRLIDILNYNQQYGLGLKVGVAGVPQLGGDQRLYWATYWGQGVAKTSFNASTAWDFIKFITLPDQLHTLNTQVKANNRPLGIIYPRISMQQELTSDPYLASYVEALSKAQSWNMGDGIRVKRAFLTPITGDDLTSSLTSIQTQVSTILANPKLIP